MFCRYLLSAMSCFQFRTNLTPLEAVSVVTLTHCLLLIDQSNHFVFSTLLDLFVEFIEVTQKLSFILLIMLLVS